MRIFVVLAALPAVADALAVASANAHIMTRPVRMRASLPTASMVVPEFAEPFASNAFSTSAVLADASFSGLVADFSTLSGESQIIVAAIYGVGLAAVLQVVRVLFELLISLAKTALKTVLQIGFVVALVEFFGIVPPP